MNIEQGKPIPAESVTEDGEVLTTEPPAAANPLAAFDASTLKAMTTSSVMGDGMIAFLPRSMAEAMEFAKLMAASNFVPPHLRGQRGDCLAVVLQSVRWNADPFAVANKTYFVNDRMAFEAQLVAAVVNTSNILNGRLQVSWQGTVGQRDFQCTVRGMIKGDSEVHELIQEIDTITTRNSPLWKQSQRIQLGYYTMRGWSRLFTPEVLLGIYTPDELEANPGALGTQTVIPPRPTRAAVAAQAKEVKAADDRVAGRIPDDAEDTAEGDETQQDTAATETDQNDEPEDQDDSIFVAAATQLIEKITKSGSRKVLDNLVNTVAKQQIDALPEQYRTQVMKATDEKRAWFARL